MRLLDWRVLFVVWALATSPLGAADDPESTFPVAGILPKQEIGAERFLAEHPDYDGRGVVVAIFDTGVDPGAEGLSTTPDGRPKILDLIDATGAGDVAMTEIRYPEDGQIEGLSGKRLTLPASVLSGDDEQPFRVGLARAYQIFPRQLVDRLREQRKERFAIQQHQLEARLRRAILDFEAEHPRPDDQQAGRLEELRARLTAAQAAWKSYDDPGPLIDCVVFHDGTRFRALVDTQGDGDLADQSPLADFDVERQWATLGFGSGLNFGVHIYDQGQTLSLVTDCGAHGTHVAGIVAGYYPDEPELSGIAPGAQIISVKIGDARLGSMETGRALARALAAAQRHGVDLVNMSYGEPTAQPARGALAEMFSELVEEHGVLFVASAGNSGPALGTVGAPGGTCRSLLGVGAYVSPAMMAAEYTLRTALPENAYTWTSRGPTADGSRGVSLFAPGGAIAPVPTWTGNRNVRMNGTSMAAPNACGAVALLLSGLKAEGVEFSPASVERALQNTARKLKAIDSPAQGPGLIQVDAAFEALVTHAEAPAERVRLVAETVGGEPARGLVLRQPHELAEVLDVEIELRPKFPQAVDFDQRRGFQLRLELSASAEWVEVGRYAILAESGRRVSLRVDPRKLAPGFHEAEVQAVDVERPERGPLVRFPITVLVPEPPSQSPALWQGEADFVPGSLHRTFVVVPKGATWLELTLRLGPGDGDRRFVVHTTQARPGRSFREDESKQYVRLLPGRDTRLAIPVTSGVAMEICLAQYWSSLGESALSWEFAFRGLMPDDREVALAAGQGGRVLGVTSQVASERLDPEARLTTHRRVIAPESAMLEPLDDPRDTLFDGRQMHRLVLEYAWDMGSGAGGQVTPHWPAFNQLLYDSPAKSLFWVLDDPHGRLITAGDPYPRPVRLGPGKHRLRLELRHADVAWLEAQRSLLMTLDRPLDSPIALSVHPHRAAAAGGPGRFAGVDLAHGQRHEFVLGEPPTARLPSGLAPGDSLVGTIQYSRAQEHRPGSGQRPGGWPLTWTAGPSARSKSAAAKDSGEWSTEALADQVFDQRVGVLRSIPEDREDLFERYAEQLLDARPNDLQVLRVKLHRLDDPPQGRKPHLARIVALCDRIVEAIDPDDLWAWERARDRSQDPPGEADRRKQQREWLVDALYRKGRALVYMRLPDVLEMQPIADGEAHDAQVAAAVSDLRQWVDTSEKDWYLLHCQYARQKDEQGEALRVLNKHLADAPPEFFPYKKRRDIYEELGWDHWAEYESAWLLIRFPTERCGL